MFIVIKPFSSHSISKVFVVLGCSGSAVLGGSVCPLAVFRCVVSVIVNPINRIAKWVSAHVGKEVGISLPSLANLDASGTVVFEPFVFRILAPLFHLAPDFVLLRSTVAMHQVAKRISSAHNVIIVGLLI